MRCFIAIDFPEEIKKEFRKILEVVSPLSKDVKWVPIENIHVTIKFLGEVEDTLIQKISQRLIEVSCRHNPFSIEIKGVGMFPNERRPNVLWVGINKPEPLTNLYQDIEDSLIDLGFSKEKREFSPHVTIGRVKNPKNITPVIKTLNEYRDKVFGIATITDFFLMKSILLPLGAKYSKLSTFKLTEIE